AAAGRPGPGGGRGRTGAATHLGRAGAAPVDRGRLPRDGPGPASSGRRRGAGLGRDPVPDGSDRAAGLGGGVPAAGARAAGGDHERAPARRPGLRDHAGPAGRVAPAAGDQPGPGTGAGGRVAARHRSGRDAGAVRRGRWHGPRRPGGGPVRVPGDTTRGGVMIKVLLADDEELIRDAVATLLELESDLSVVARAGTGRQAVRAALDHRPDVAVVDLDMPELDGLAVSAELTRALPDCRVIILTGRGRPAHLRRALRAGASGFVTKGASAGTLARAIRRVTEGARYVDPELAAELLVGP